MLQQFIHKRARSNTVDSDTEVSVSVAQASVVSTPTSRIVRRTDTFFEASPDVTIRPSCSSLQTDTMNSPRSEDQNHALLSPPRTRIRANGLQSPGSRGSFAKQPKPFSNSIERPVVEKVHRFIQYDTPSTRFNARSVSSFRSLSPEQGAAQNTPKRPKRLSLAEHPGIARAAGSFHMLELPTMPIQIQSSSNVYVNICNASSGVVELYNHLTQQLKHAQVHARVVHVGFTCVYTALSVLFSDMSGMNQAVLLSSVLTAVHKLLLFQCDSSLRHTSVCERCIGSDKQVDELYLMFSSFLQLVWQKYDNTLHEMYPFVEEPLCYCVNRQLCIDKREETDTLPVEEFEDYSSKTSTLHSLLNTYIQQLFSEQCECNMNVLLHVDNAPAASVEIVMHPPLRSLLADIAAQSVAAGEEVMESNNIIFTMQIYRESKERGYLVTYSPCQKFVISSSEMSNAPLSLVAVAVSSTGDQYTKPLLFYEQNCTPDQDQKETADFYQTLSESVEYVADKMGDILEKQSLTSNTNGMLSQWYLYLSSIGCVGDIDFLSQAIHVDGIQMLQFHEEQSKRMPESGGNVRIITPYTNSIPEVCLRVHGDIPDCVDGAKLYTVIHPRNNSALGAFSTVNRVMDNISGQTFALKSITRTAKITSIASSVRSYNEFAQQSYVYNDERRIPSYPYPLVYSTVSKDGDIYETKLQLVQAKKYILQPYHAQQCEQTQQLVFAWATRGSLSSLLKSSHVLLQVHTATNRLNIVDIQPDLNRKIQNSSQLFHTWKCAVQTVQSLDNDVVKVDKFKYPLLHRYTGNTEVSLKNIFALTLSHEEFTKPGLFCSYGLLQLLLECSTGLSRVHNKSMVHMDIKPDNILYTDEVNTGNFMSLDATLHDSSATRVLYSSSNTSLMTECLDVHGETATCLEQLSCSGQRNRYTDGPLYHGVFADSSASVQSTSHHGHAVLGDFGLARTVDIGQSNILRLTHFVNLSHMYPEYNLDNNLSMLSIPTIQQYLRNMEQYTQSSFVCEAIGTILTTHDFVTSNRNSMSILYPAYLPPNFSTPAVSSIDTGTTLGCVIPMPGQYAIQENLSTFYQESFHLLNSLDAMEGDQRYLCLVQLQGELDKYVSKPISVHLSQTQSLTQILSQSVCTTDDHILAGSKVWTEDWTQAMHISSGVPVHIDGSIRMNIQNNTSQNNRNRNPSHQSNIPQRCAASLDTCDIFSLGCSQLEIYSTLPAPKAGAIWSQLRNKKFYSYQQHENLQQDEEAVLQYVISEELDIRNTKYAYILQYKDFPLYREQAAAAIDAVHTQLHARMSGIQLQVEVIALLQSILESFRFFLLLHNEPDPYMMQEQHVEYSHQLPLHCQDRQDQACICCNYVYNKHAPVATQLQLIQEFSALCTEQHVSLPVLDLHMEQIEYTLPKLTCKLVPEIIRRVSLMSKKRRQNIHPTRSNTIHTMDTFHCHIVHILSRQINSLLAPTTHYLLGSLQDNVPVVRPLAGQQVIHVQESLNTILDRVMYVYETIMHLISIKCIQLLPNTIDPSTSVQAYTTMTKEDHTFMVLDTTEEAANVLLYMKHQMSINRDAHKQVMEKCGLTNSIVDTTTMAALLSFLQTNLSLLSDNRPYIVVLDKHV